MPNQTVILNTLDLLEIMQEGLSYIKQKVIELNKEAAITVLLDTVSAFSSIEKAIIPMLDELEENEIQKKTNELRKILDLIVKEYENNNGQKYYEIVQLSLEPAFNKRKEEIEGVLRPYVAS